MIERRYDQYPNGYNKYHAMFSPNLDDSLIPEMKAAYDFVSSMSGSTCYIDAQLFEGWVLREAFLAGIVYARNNPPSE